MNAFIDRMFFAANGHVEGDYYYFRLIRRDDNNPNLIWDNVAKEVAEGVSWADSVIDMPEVGTTGQYPVEIPANIPGGSYYVTIYKRLGSAPANSDDVSNSYLTKIGDIFGF